MTTTKQLKRGCILQPFQAKAAAEGRLTAFSLPVKIKRNDLCPDEAWERGVADLIQEWREQDGRWFGIDGWTQLSSADPPYQVGDLLYVRETWVTGDKEPCDCLSGACNHLPDIHYLTDWGGIDDDVAWNSAKSMPKWAARTWLRVTGVEVRRVQDVSAEDARSEIASMFGAGGFLSKTAEKFNKTPLHWISGDNDLDLLYCYDCAEKVCKQELAKNPDGECIIDGGWRDSEDSQVFCDECQRPLDHSYTTHCCEAELAHFAENKFNPSSPDDCNSLIEMNNAVGIEGSDVADKVAKLAYQACWKSRHGSESWDRNDWVWAYKVER